MCLSNTLLPVPDGPDDEDFAGVDLEIDALEHFLPAEPLVNAAPRP
jgi:hypothetical protein